METIEWLTPLGKDPNAKRSTFDSAIPFKMISPEFDVKSAENDMLIVEGYAATFYPRDRQGDTIDPHAFDETMEQYIQNPQLLAFHYQNKKLGRIREAHIDEKGLYVVGEIPKSDDKDIEMVRDMIKDGTLRHFSIGGVFHRVQVGQKAFHITKVDPLVEISVVSVPANPHAIFSVQEQGQKSMDGYVYGWDLAKSNEHHLAYETKSMAVAENFPFEEQLEHTKSLAEQLQDTKSVMEEVFAPHMPSPRIQVQVEGRNTPDFLAYLFGSKAYGVKAYSFEIEEPDQEALKHRLLQLKNYAERTGVLVTLKAPFNVEQLLKD